MSAPDVVLLMADQLRADALGAYGHPYAVTPAMDALAAGGTRFDSAYTPSPVCVPARCALLTGLEPQATGCVDNGFPMPAEGPTLMRALRDAGYATRGVGKMHFTPDAHATLGLQSRETQEEDGVPGSDDYRDSVVAGGFGHVERPHGLRDELYYVPQLSPLPERLHPTSWVADRSVAALRDADPDVPLFLWSSFVHPHPPFAPPAPWHRLFQPSSLEDPFVPPGAAGLLTAHDHLQRRYKFRDGGDDRRLAQVIRAYYHACVSFVDAAIGRITDAVRARGRDTLIVLLADHGELLGDYGSFGKRSFLDAAARVPLVLSGAGVAAGGAVAAPASLLDVAPTVLAAAGVAPPGRSDGVRLDGLLDRDAVFGQFQTGDAGLFCVVTPTHKYVLSRPDGRELLLDRRHDPRETINHAYDVAHRSTLEALRRRATEHFDELRGLDVDALTGNAPLRLGGPGVARPWPPLGRDRDAGTLLIGDAGAAPVGSDAFEAYVRLRDRS